MYPQILLPDFLDQLLIIIVSRCLIVNFRHIVFEPTCAHARWAPMHRFLSVCLSVRLYQKLRLEKSHSSKSILDRGLKFHQVIKGI